MKKYLIILYICLFPSILFAQRGYYSKDTIEYSGINLIDRGNQMNMKSIQIKKGKKIVEYSPYEIDEYGFQKGSYYKAFTFSFGGRQERFFFERLVEGNINLYYIITNSEKRYYMFDNKLLELTEIPKTFVEYNVLLKNYVGDCVQSVKNIPFVKIRKNNLTRFFQDFNTCKNRPLPRMRYGFSIGISTYNFSVAKDGIDQSLPNHLNGSNFLVGSFLDIPINTSNLSFHPIFDLEKIGVNQVFNSGNSNDVVINSTSINVPLLLRYSILQNKITPYLQLGPVYSRNIRNKSTIYEYESTGNTIDIEVHNSTVLQKNLGGFSVGSGLISNYGSKHSWFLELNYIKLYNLNTPDRLYNRSEISLKTGLLF